MGSPLHRLVTFQQERLVRAQAFPILRRPSPGIPTHFMRARSKSSAAKDSTAHLGCGAKLSSTADSGSKVEAAERNLLNEIDINPPNRLLHFRNNAWP